MRNIIGLLIVAALPLLHGCAAVAVGGATATGVVMADDRRTVGTITEDQGIEMKASRRIGEKFGNAYINVTSYNRMVLLTGEAADAAAKSEIYKIARAVENVRDVINEIQIAGNSSLSARANDAYLTSKVKARFLDAQKFDIVHVKVVTEANTVYLLGLVTRQEAADATEIARTTGGVQRVVRVFEYLN
jgi:osmotically-inducible protein OsmY